jgi:aspartyl-tRNA synthetase
MKMDRCMIGALRDSIGKSVTIQGWLQTLRDQKKMQFLVVRDVSGAVQVVFEKNANPELAEKISALSVESGVTISGTVVDNPIVKLGGLELQLDSLRVDAPAESPVPLDPFAEALPAIDYRMDWRYLDLRSPENLLMFKVAT